MSLENWPFRTPVGPPTTASLVLTGLTPHPHIFRARQVVTRINPDFHLDAERGAQVHHRASSVAIASSRPLQTQFKQDVIAGNGRRYGGLYQGFVKVVPDLWLGQD